MSGDSDGVPRCLPVVQQYGRYYGLWPQREQRKQRKQGEYLLPIDAEELKRMDLFHKVLLEAREKALFLPDLPQHRPLRVLDLGTGTGIWAIDVAEQSTEEPVIMTVDLHNIQPEFIPPGLTTVQFDIEDLSLESWATLIGRCDLVHIRMLYGSIRHQLWPGIYQRIFSRLAPGSGYIEHVEIDWKPRWEEGTQPRESALEEWSILYLKALKQLGRDAGISPVVVRREMKAAGFTDFREVTIRCYVNACMSDRREWEVANWFNLVLDQGFEPMSLKPMIEGLRMSQDGIRELCRSAKEEICILRHRAYFTVHIWSARRPPY